MLRSVSLVARAASIGAVLAAALWAGPARAQQFLDLTTLTTGTSGTFTGALGGIPVAGAIITNSDRSFALFSPSTTINHPSHNISFTPFSNSEIYTPTVPLTDRVGYTKMGSVTAATFIINFGAPITDPVFHIANLDSSTYDFAPTVGLGGVSLLSGNGGGGDGLVVNGTAISDANPNTVIGVDPATTPPTTGARSAYGSVRLLGTFTTLTANVTSSFGDGGSFTLSTGPAAAAVPEQGTLALLGTGLLPLAGVAVRRRRAA